MAMAEGLHIALQQDAPIPLDFALSVAPNETVALVGPSGAGKTTVLRSIAGLYHPATASIRCGGQVWHDSEAGLTLPPFQRRVGFVFQSYALFPHMTALENVMEAMLDLPIAVRRDEGRQLLDLMQLNGLETRHPANLSGGQQQRVALARALARRPQVLLLDEPFSAVDYPTRKLLHQALHQVRETFDIPIILVTHDIDDATKIADTFCFMQHGQTVESGPTDTLMGQPASHLSRWIG